MGEVAPFVSIATYQVSGTPTRKSKRTRGWVEISQLFDRRVLLSSLTASLASLASAASNMGAGGPLREGARDHRNPEPGCVPNRRLNSIVIYPGTTLGASFTPPTDCGCPRNDPSSNATDCRGTQRSIAVFCTTNLFSELQPYPCCDINVIEMQPTLAPTRVFHQARTWRHSSSLPSLGRLSPQRLGSRRRI